MRPAVALLVLLTFGCASVRVPAGSVDGDAPRSGMAAEPQVARPWGWGAWEASIAFQVHVPFHSDLTLPGDPPLDGDAGPTDGDEVESLPPPPPAPLPEMEKLDLDRHGFFDGDETVLEVDLIDRATGRVLWTRVARSDADPRDGDDMARLLDDALQGLSP